MKYCPHCRKPTLKTEGECPHCHGDLLGAPAPPGGGAKGPAAPGYGGLSGGDELDADLELDIAPPTPRISTPPMAELDLDGAPSPAAPPAEKAAQARASAPAGRPSTLEGGALLDPFEVDDVAKFGPKPASPFATPAYALRVRKRSAELAAEVHVASRELAAAREERLEVLAKLGERARVAGYSSDDVSPALAAVESAERQASGAEDAAAGERERHKAQLAELQAQIERVNARMQSPRATEASLTGQVAAREEQKRRAVHVLGQAEAALRAAEAQLEAARADATDPEAPARASAVEAGLPALVAGREGARTAVAQLEGPIEELRTELAAVRAELDALAAERKSHVDAREAERKRHDEAMRNAASASDHASKTVRDRLAQVGEIVRYEGPADPWAKELFASIDQRTERVNAALRKHALLEAAAASFDQAAVRQGYVVIAAGAALVLFGGIGLIILIAALT